MSLPVGLLPLIGLGWYFEGAAQRQIVNELKTHLARQA